MARNKIKNEAPSSPPPLSPEYLPSCLEPEEGGGTGSGTGEGPTFENHCLFCLQPQSLQTLLEVDGRDPQLRKDIQPLMDYLTGTDPNQIQEGTRGVNEIWMGKVTNLPPMMCPACHPILAELYRLHRELLRTQWLIQKQTDLAREIVTEAGGQPGSTKTRTKTAKQLFYSKIRSSEMSEEEADAVTKFVEELHGKIALEDSWKQKVIFPSSPPPYFVPEASSGSDSKSMFSSLRIPLRLRNCSVRLSRSDIDNMAKSRERVTSKNFADTDDENYGTALLPKLELEAVESVAGSECNVEEDDDMFKPPPSQHEASDSPSEPDDDPPPTKRASKAKAPTVQSLVTTETGTSQYCDLCDDLLPSPDMERHLEEKHHVHDFISKCPNPSCPCIFSCEGKLQKHLRFHPSKYKCLRAAKLPTKLKPRQCDSCGLKTFSNPEFREHLQKHERELMEKETNGFPFPCPLPGCRHGFALRQTLEEHISFHNPGEGSNGKKQLVKSKVAPKQECDLCGEGILSSDMVAHLEGHSPQLKEYITKCLSPSCPHVFSCVGKMEKHLRGQRVKRGGRIVWWNGSKPCRREANIPSGAAPVKCDACSLMVTNRSFLKSHLQQHELMDHDKQEKNLACPMPDCDKRFALRQSVHEHLISHDLRPRSSPQDGLEQECSVCKESIPLENISGHLRECHGVTEIIPCRSCPLMFHNWEALLDHLFQHRLGSTNSGMVCDMCGDQKLKFQRYESLRQHFFNVHQIGSKLTCEECEREYFSKDRLSQHKERCHTASTNEAQLKKKREATAKCDQCSDTFLTRDRVLNHKIKVHGAPPVQCKFCGQGFLSVFTWRKHQRAHLGLKKSFTCSVAGCGKVFKVKAGWRRHEKGAHLPPDTAPLPKLFICDICGAGYNFKPSLKAHLDKVHQMKDVRQVSHICEVCGISLSSAGGLGKHKLVHSGMKPFQCPVCSQPFRRKINMLRHLKKHEELGDNFKPRGTFKNERKRRVKK